MGQGCFTPGLVSGVGAGGSLFLQGIQDGYRWCWRRICPSQVPSIFGSMPGQGLEVGHEGLQPRSKRFLRWCGIHPFLLRKKASPLGAGSTHGQPSSQLWLLSLGGSCGPRLHGAPWAQGPVGRNHKPTALRASWEKGCPGVNGACVVVQARSQGTRGCEAPPSADVQDDLQGNFSTPSASLSPPEHLGEWAGRGDMGWCMCPSEGTRERGPFLPPTLWLPLRHSQCKWKAGFFPFLRRGWKALKNSGDHHPGRG